MKSFHNIWDYWVDFGVENRILPTSHNTQGVCKFQLFTLQHTQSCQKPLKKKNLNIWKKVSKYSYSIWEDWVSFGTKTLILHTTYETQGVCKIHVLALEHTQSCKKPLQQKKWNILKKVYKYSRSIWEDWVSFGTKT